MTITSCQIEEYRYWKGLERLLLEATEGSVAVKGRFWSVKIGWGRGDIRYKHQRAGPLMSFGYAQDTSTQPWEDA